MWTLLAKTPSSAQEPSLRGENGNKEFLLLFCFFLLLLFTRLFLRHSVLELDEAEQIVVSQQLQWGYANQPPLYFWLQWAFFRVFGVSLLSIALLKSLLLCACVYIFYQITAYHCQQASRLSAVLAWAFMPAISLDLLRDNTHSVLALCCAVLTWFLFLSDLPKKTFFLGLAIGFGFLSKFNYVLFLFFLFLSTPHQMRRQLLASCFLGILLASPYFIWLSNHVDIGLHTAYKLAPPEKTRLRGLINLGIALFFFLAPVYIVLTGFFYGAKKQIAPFSSPNRLLQRYFKSALIGLPLLIVICGFRDFETRWLIPLFFMAPLILLNKISIQPGSFRIRLFNQTCLIIMAGFLALLIHRSFLPHHQRPLLPITKLAAQIPSDISYVVSDSLWLLGNLGLVHPTALLYRLDTNNHLPTGKLFVAWVGAKTPVWLGESTQVYRDRSERVIGGIAIMQRP